MKKLAKKIIKMNVILFYCITTTLYVGWVELYAYYLDKYGIEYGQNVIHETGQSTGSAILFQNVLTSASKYVDKAVSFPLPYMLEAIVIPTIEEIVFRWLPLLLLINIFRVILERREKKNIDTYGMKKFERFCIIFVVLVGSAIFGYSHGNFYNILDQGVLGIAVYLVYLRVFYRRKWAGKRCYAQIYPLLASVLYHISINQLWRII